MGAFTALLDASVLYPAPLRDVLLELATTDIYRAKWSNAIHDEWITALLRNEPHRDRTALDRTRALMDRATRDCLVEGFELLIASLALPDPDDRHVLAAAIAGRCDVIVTANLRDFPERELRHHGIEAQHPDSFLSNHLSLAPGVFCQSIHRVRARLKNPPYDVTSYLAILTQQGLVATAAELEQFSALI